MELHHILCEVTAQNQMEAVRNYHSTCSREEKHTVLIILIQI